MITPPKMTPKDQHKAMRLIDEGKTYQHVADIFGVSKQWIWELKQKKIRRENARNGNASPRRRSSATSNGVLSG